MGGPNPKWLHSREFVDLAPDTVGVEVSVDHAECPSGIDRKKRLAIKRVHGGVVAFCYHCGKKGASFKRTGQAAWDGLEVGPLPATPEFSRMAKQYEAARWIDAYERSEHGLVDHPVTAGSARAWLAAKGFMWVGESGVRWGAPEGETQALMLPIRRFDGAVVGVQVRRYFGGAYNRKIHGPKYDTHLFERKFAPYVYGQYFDKPERLRTEPIVVVEDYLSAQRLCLYVPAVPLYASSMSNETLAYLSRTTRRLGVWLDNDKPEVFENAVQIGVRAEPLFDEVAVICDAKEPAHYNDEQLFTILHDRGLV